MKRATYLGSAATMYLGLGCRPRAVRITTADGLKLAEWNEDMLGIHAIAGGVLTGNHADAQRVAYAGGAGITPWFGGTMLTTESSSYLVPLAHNPTYNTDLKGTAAVWTLNTAGTTGSGKFDVAPNTTDGAGVGSMVQLLDRQIGRAHV